MATVVFPIKICLLLLLPFCHGDLDEIQSIGLKLNAMVSMMKRLNETSEALKLAQKADQEALKEANEEIAKLKQVQKLIRPFRTCFEIKQNGVLLSDFYKLDPIGDGNWIEAYCNMDQDPPITTFEIERKDTKLYPCNQDACAQADNVMNDKIRQQIEQLVRISDKCWQSVKVRCNHNPVQGNPSGLVWIGKDGNDTPYFL